MKKILLASFLSLTLFSSDTQAKMSERTQNHINVCFLILTKALLPAFSCEAIRQMHKEITEKTHGTLEAFCTATFYMNWLSLLKRFDIDNCSTYTKKEKELATAISNIALIFGALLYAKNYSCSSVN